MFLSALIHKNQNRLQLPLLKKEMNANTDFEHDIDCPKSYQHCIEHGPWVRRMSLVVRLNELMKKTFL
jgi:hypothetical protein